MEILYNGETTMNKIAGILLLFQSSLITGFGLWAAIAPTGFLNFLHMYETSYTTEVKTYHIDPLFMEYVGVTVAIFGLVLFILAAKRYRASGKF